MGALDIGLLDEYLFSCVLGEWKRSHQAMDGTTARKLVVVRIGNLTCVAEPAYVY